jgi:hypothetical protein
MKRILLDWNNCGGGGRPLAPMPTVPSPVPPWKRPAESPLSNTLFGDGTISFQFDTTYLNSTSIRTIGSPPVVSPYVIQLPAAPYVRKIIRIYIPGQNITPFTTAQFSVVGTFVGFSSLLLGDVPTSNGVALEWDGTGFHFLGGNCTVVP